MTPFVKCATALLLLAGALPAAAQAVNALDRQAGVPAGLALPSPGVAVAEEAAGTGTTPAAAGFVGAPALQWFREGNVARDSVADGLYLAAPAGPLGVGYSVEWVRPGDAPFPRFRKNTLSLTFGDHHAWSLGFAWNRYWSSNAAVADLESWSAGLTVRPFRHLSLGAAALNRDARLGGTRLPSRYDLGVATRLLSDVLTLSADVLADDRGRDDFRATHLAFGAQAEVPAGFAVGAQVLVPVRADPGLSRDPSYLAVLSWNAPRTGVTGGVAATPARTGWLVGVRGSTERYPAPASGRLAPTLHLARELDPDRIPFLDLGERDPYGRLLGRLAALADDDEIPAVVVRIDDLSLGSGRTEELRAALLRIGARKPVVAYLTGGGTREYWLASAASAIAVPPGSALMVNGLATSSLYLRDALARGGIAFEVVAVGAYKSAAEPLVRDGPSPAAREAANALLDDVFGRLVADLAKARRLAPERVVALVDQGLFGSAEAKEAGLVDAVVWPDELEAFTQRAAGRPLRLAGPYRPGPVRAARRWGAPPLVEVIRVEGAITAGRGGRGLSAELAGAESIVAQLRRAAADRAVKAIVLRIESPGGDGLASDLIWRAVVKAREKKPVVASMGDYAASGGYLAAAGADVIVAEPSTLTGSIGVFVLKPELSGLLAKLAIGRVDYARGEVSQLTSVGKPWTEKERAAAAKQVEAFYALFVSRVAEGRKLSREKVEAAAGGRVWTGKQALERGLVDRLGSLGDAVTLAAGRAGLAAGDFAVRRAEGGGGSLLAGASAQASRGPVERVIEAVPELRALTVLSEMGPVLALPVDWVLPPAP